MRVGIKVRSAPSGDSCREVVRNRLTSRPESLVSRRGLDGVLSLPRYYSGLKSSVKEKEKTKKEPETDRPPETFGSKKSDEEAVGDPVWKNKLTRPLLYPSGEPITLRSAECRHGEDSERP